MFFKHDLEHLQFGQGRIYRILEPKNRVGNRSFKMIFSEIIKKAAVFLDKANTETYGTPEPTTVTLTVEKGGCREIDSSKTGRV